MLPRVLKRIRDLIHRREYLMTLHAEEEMCDDGLSVFDVEHAILTASIVERQRDEQTGEWKYRLQGKTTEGENAGIVAKIGPTGKLVIITVYLC